MKALSPIVVNLLWIVIEDRLEQDWNACVSIFVTELGNITRVRLEQLRNALAPIVVTVFGSVMEVNGQLWNAVAPIVVSPDVNIMDVKPEYWNAFALIFFTELGIVMEVKFVQLWNAFTAIPVTLYIIPLDGSVILSGIVIIPLALAVKTCALVWVDTNISVPKVV